MLKANRERPFQRMDTLGMTAGTWARVLQSVPNPVDRGYGHRLVGNSALSLASSAGKRMRHLTDRAPIPRPEDVEVTFIVGHWRSGTTFLHHLLGADTERFASLPTSMAVFPELYGTPLLMPVLHALGIGRPYRRLIDNVMLSPDSPMELEFAILNLIGQSEYLSVAFPRSRREFLRFLRARDEDTTPAEDAAWRAAVRDTTGRLARSGRMVLHKNPPSTATALRLKALFPRARFVFLYREPLGVFRSTVKTWRTLTRAGTLQWDDDDAALEDYVLDRYVLLHEAWLAQRDRIPANDRVTLTFEGLLADPMAAVRQVFERFGWGPVDEAVFRRYLDGVTRYARGDYAHPDEGAAERVLLRWQPIVERLSDR